MDGFGYIGQAGTGKTTQLIKKVEDSIEFESWPQTASILAITFMHGSRRRLENKLKLIQSKGINVCCQTIDSFCLNILQRYRSYLGINHTIVVSNIPNELSEIEDRLHIGFNKIREKAIELLEFSIIREVLSFSYPLVVVDEFQDCNGTLLDVIKKLFEGGGLFVAADEFQNLDDSPECPATLWLNDVVELNELKHIWRTDDSKILDSAKALRNNESTNNGVKVQFSPSKDLAAFSILSNMQWYDKMGSGEKTVAVISPVSPGSDTFVQKTLERLHKPMERKVTKNKRPYKLFPKPFQIDSERRITFKDVIEKLNGWESLDMVTEDNIDSWKFEEHSGFEIGVKRAKKLMKLRNTKQLSKAEFSSLISSGIHFVNTYITRSGQSRIFLTVHGAKNREFDDVFVLWPKYTLPSGDLYLRKLMYNAITRAKRKVVVIVQGTKKRRSEYPLNLLA